ncbi:hypothetical protein KSP39_PZI009383 [Platanthera zijinensis]|uniref:Uncharacterized protein n=1 Tax=Platanthera zijinensis TaxID=2320716 RepID=A0AAP0BLD6_9ASPA
MRMKYVEIEKEDLEEKRSRRARFLIYRTLEQADSTTSHQASGGKNRGFWSRKPKFYVRLRKKLSCFFLPSRRRSCSGIIVNQISYIKRVLRIVPA